ncbi:MAG: HDOD domain-containing protein [Gammaproteobacteria bacterium]|nr:HDOD domain-containing protein [Gammaproteobacteria bacterium]NNJ50036.1 HDOD domain-containing protein [Gammaproteobacteria bacterium]
MNQKAKQILQKADVDRLPSLPHVLLQLLDICHDESLSFTELTNILRQDPALYARVCSVCHHHDCEAGHKLKTDTSTSIESSLQHLGINTIKSIAVTATVQQFFSRTSLERTDFLKEHWRHSLYCAHVARAIAEICDYSDTDEVYTTGLMHNIGQLVLETAYPDKYTTTFAQLTDDTIFHDLEQDAFGTTHQQVGAELLRRHGANSFVYDAVLYHHESVEHIQDAHPLVKIINLANMLTSSYFKPEEDQQVFDAAEQLLAIKKPTLLEILDKSKAHVETTAQTLEIGLPFDGMDGQTIKKITASDELKQVQLAEQVRNIALLDGIHQHLSRSGAHSGDVDALFNIISQNIGILFGVSQCILFLYDAASDRVEAISADNQPPQLADISIPLTSNRSLVTDALLNKEACHSFTTESFEHNLNELSIVDRQLIGITEQEGIICLPMMMNNAAIGTLILGMDKTQYENLWKQLPLLMRFVNEIAHTISVSSSSSQSAVSDEERSHQLEQKIREVLHEVRNPLSIMNNYLGILGYKLENDKPAQEDVQTIKTEIERITDILNRLTEQESSTDETSPVDINAIIADLTHVFQTSLFASKNIQISLDLDERIESLQTNANALKQIYTNLIKNAVEALPANGQLMVYTQDNVNVDGKQHIELSVADDGPGIDSDILPQLFSPVESTKGDDHAGLGLTIVKNLVNELHGSISCRSSDKGTSFHILLPK